MLLATVLVYVCESSMITGMLGNHLEYTVYIT